MCGITGIYSFNEQGKNSINKIEDAVKALYYRGPDGNGVYRHGNVALGHTRLSIIDTSNAASQPFTDGSGRYTIVFNGEFYNYKEYRKELESDGVAFKSTSDTEVLLYLYIKYGNDFLEKVNGCFAIAIYDNIEEALFIARDRMGINPVLIYTDSDKLIFASEMKALMAFDIPKDIDNVSLVNYLQFNYIPAPHSIFKNVFKLSPGEYLIVTKDKTVKKRYYKIPKYDNSIKPLSYKDAENKLFSLMDEAVERRMVSDVPLGAFLSGGIDSSVIVALASKYTDKLNTFSVGYKDEPYFDETSYAKLVADRYKTNHTVFSLSNDDLYANLNDVLEYTDEPFADSSALAVHILSMQTKKHVTVALSGDGADEMFSGYNKHMAHFKASRKNATNAIIRDSKFILDLLPQSRDGSITNKIRQVARYSKGLNFTDKDRYWNWCSLLSEEKAIETLKENIDMSEYSSRKSVVTENINGNGGINEILYTDMHMVLQNDMLTKVDLMSMANSLEVRTPFLDHNVVDFAFSLPQEYKINSNIKKRILQDTFRDHLPEELYSRPKHGFEVPLLKWFKTDLKSLILDDLLSDDFIIEQNIFNLESIKYLKQKLFSSNPGDVHAQIWGMIVFQHWWKKYCR